MKKRHITPYESAILDVEEAKANLAIAKDHFNYAEGKFFYIANEELTVAEMRLNMALHKARLLAPEASK
jgi:hypothetical protein